MASEDKEAEKEIKIEELAHRYRQAERQTLRDRPPEEKHKWLKAKCPHCGYELRYAPKETFKGDIRCPDCGKFFHITRLDDFKEGAK